MALEGRSLEGYVNGIALGVADGFHTQGAPSIRVDATTFGTENFTWKQQLVL